MTCRLSSDRCQIVTFPEDADRVMLIVERTRECANGKGDCDADLDIAHFGDIATHLSMRKIVECDDAGECEALIEHIGDGPHARGEVTVEIAGDDMSSEDVVVIRRLGLDGPNVFFSDSKVSLACPEGDASLRVDKEEAEDVFLCPKHSVPMEKVEMHGPHRVIEIKTDGDEQ